MKRFMLLSVVLAVVLAAGLQPASATVLTFGGGFGVAPGGGAIAIPDAYGDNVSSVGAAPYTYEEGNGFTPNVVADYSSPPWYYATTGDGNYWNDGVAFLYGDYGTYKFGFTPDDGLGVRLNSFQIKTWAPGYPGSGQLNWKVLGDASVLASGSLTMGTLWPIDVNTGLTGYYAGKVTLQLDNVSVEVGTLAVDNVNFDQGAVPEPSSLVLLATGLLGLLAYAWRKRR